VPRCGEPSRASRERDGPGRAARSAGHRCPRDSRAGPPARSRSCALLEGDPAQSQPALSWVLEALLGTVCELCLVAVVRVAGP